MILSEEQKRSIDERVLAMPPMTEEQLKRMAKHVAAALRSREVPK